jgi:DNA-binding transcriptional MerR regulator
MARAAAPARPPSDAQGRLRIDELAQRSGIASGTIRFYQREGLIDGPEREGRVAYYSEDHQRRLERVRALQAQGLPLGLIGDLLEREDAGEDIGGWLALDSAVFGPGAEPQPVDQAALQRLDLSEADLAALEAAGVLRRSSNGELAALPGMIELIGRLLDAGVSRQAIRAGAGSITASLSAVAETMASLGWEAFDAERARLASADESAAEETLAKLEHLRSLARRIVSTHFPVLLDEAIRARAADFAGGARGGRRDGAAERAT